MSSPIAAVRVNCLSDQLSLGVRRLADALAPALTERAVAECALASLRKFPGVLGASIKLREADGGLREFASSGLEQPQAASAACLAAAGAVPSQSSCCCPQPHHACVPFDSGKGTLGVLCLKTVASSTAPGTWQAYQQLGNHCAVAIQRVYGHRKTAVAAQPAAWQSDPRVLAAVVNTSGGLVCMADADGCIRLFNPACEKTMGWAEQEVLGKPGWEVFRRADGAAIFRSIFSNPRHQPLPEQMQGDWIAKDGGRRSINWSITWLRKADASVEYCLAMGVDVTALRGAEEKVRYLSNFDLLTGLPNRILLRDRVLQLQEQVVADGKLIGFLLLKPERLGLISESLGIELERAILVRIAARLGKWSQGKDSVARVGERAFAIVAVRQTACELSTLARELLELIAAPFRLEEQELHLNPCIGIAIFPNDGDDYDTVRQGAEAAMRRAMASKAERYAFYRPELNQNAHERFRFESALRHALERDEFVLHYQPQVSLSTNAIIGVEALVRWQHPQLGLIAPGRFICLAEETGLILPIGEWVLRRACQQSCEWQRQGLPAVPVSVNLSARQFSENIAATVARVLAETGLEPHLLELELTESASMEDPQKTTEILHQLKKMGVKLAIDDFGTGYSNLAYLKRFPVDKLKLDQSFIKDITGDPDDLSIARAVIAMAHGLRLTVIAEGVETPGQLALLAENGCDEIQGYLFSRPVPAEVCARMLADGTVLGLLGRASQPSRPAVRTLLYVDDEVRLLAAVRRAMRRRGYRVLVAASAAQAFEILAHTEVGVILCDQRMPGMSGIAFLSRVKHMYPTVTRMVLSGYTDLQMVTDAVNLGAIFKFFTKPWDEEALCEAMREGFELFESHGAPADGQAS